VPQNKSGHGGKEKTSLHCPYQELNPGHPAHSLATIPTELPWLSQLQFCPEKTAQGASQFVLFTSCKSVPVLN